MTLKVAQACDLLGRETHSPIAECEIAALQRAMLSLLAYALTIRDVTASDGECSVSSLSNANAAVYVAARRRLWRQLGRPLVGCPGKKGEWR